MSRPSLRFLLSRRWIGFAVFVVLLAGVCIRLGFWQIHRLEHRLDANDRTREHFRMAPAPLNEALPRGASVDDDGQWMRITATGTYDVEHQVTVKFVTRDGAPGVDVVTPLVLADGRALLVDRGWLATKNTVDRPTDVPAPPLGSVTVTAWLRPDNDAGDDAVRVNDGQIRAISSAGLAESVPYRLVGGYANLRSQDPAASRPLDREPKPDLGQGPHFFYALQWWFFAGLAVVGYFWFARVEWTERRATQDQVRT